MNQAVVTNMRRSVTVLMTLIIGSVTGCAAPGKDAVPLDGKTLKAPGLEADIRKREVRLEATVCLSRGILEYLVCLPGTFEHETIFTAKCRPSELHLALLLIGLVPRAFELDPEWWESAREDKQALVNVGVEYELDGKLQRRRITEFLVNRESPDRKVPDRWVFTGSEFYQGNDGKSRYGADITGVVIGLIPEGVAVIRLGAKTGVPYRGEDQGLEINPDTIPAVGTKVRLIFTPYEKGGAAEPPAQGTAPSPRPGGAAQNPG